jgi:hypothetical protein
LVTACHHGVLPNEETKLPIAVALVSPLKVIATTFGAVRPGTPWLMRVGN